MILALLLILSHVACLVIGAVVYAQYHAALLADLQVAKTKAEAVANQTIQELIAIKSKLP